MSLPEITKLAPLRQLPDKPSRIEIDVSITVNVQRAEPQEIIDLLTRLQEASKGAK